MVFLLLVVRSGVYIRVTYSSDTPIPWSYPSLEFTTTLGRTFLINVGPSARSAAKMQLMRLCRSLPNLISSFWAACVAFASRPLQEKSQIKRGFLPTWGMASSGDIHYYGIFFNSSQGNMATWNARSCSASSFLAKVLSFCAEECAP